MLRRVALVRTDVSDEHTVSFIRVTRIGELGTTLGITSNRYTLRRNIFFAVKHSSGMLGGRFKCRLLAFFHVEVCYDRRKR
jgi:hypothetical protein